MDTGRDESDRESGAAANAAQEDPTSLTIHELMPKVMQSIGVIGKDRTNEAQRFQFRGIDDVMTAVQPALLEHGVYYVPEVVASEHERYQTKNGTAMRSATITVRYTFYGPSGDSVIAIGIGEAADAGDKATSKALAMALKYALLQTFCVPTGDPDPDSQNVEGAGDPARAPRQSSARRSRSTPTPKASGKAAPAPKASGTIAPTVQEWLDRGIKQHEIMLALRDACQAHGDRVPAGLAGINTKELKAETLAALKAAIDARVPAPAAAESSGAPEGAEPAPGPEEAVQSGTGGCSKHPDKAEPETCEACHGIVHGWGAEAEPEKAPA